MLSDQDVREILKLIDESSLDELLIETSDFKLHVVRGAGAEVVSRDPRPETGDPTSDGLAINAPMLGTFYRAEAPGAAPFVEVGAKVEPDTVVCLIEVMKMMNSIPAGVSGTIAETLAWDRERGLPRSGAGRSR